MSFKGKYSNLFLTAVEKKGLDFDLQIIAIVAVTVYLNLICLVLTNIIVMLKMFSGSVICRDII